MYEKTNYGPGPFATPIYTIGSAFAFGVVYAVSRNPPPMDWSVPPVIAAGIVALFLVLASGAIGRLLERRHKRLNQLKRDRRARLILEQARQGRAGDYSLYLRGFRSTGQMPAEDESTLVQPGFDPRDAESAAVDLEAVFAQVLESEAPVVALGRPGEQVGVGRVETQDVTWKQDFEILADNALLLVVLPFPGRSVEWEIKWAKLRGHLGKSLFVMPPKRPWHLSLPARRQPLSWPEVWSAVTTSLSHEGLSLPPYENGGMVFFLGADGTASARTSLQGCLRPMWVATRVGALLGDTSRRRRVAGSKPG